MFEAIYELQQYQVITLIILSPLCFNSALRGIASKISFYVNFEVFDKMIIKSTIEDSKSYDFGVFSIMRGYPPFAYQKFSLFLGLYILGFICIPILRVLIEKIKTNKLAKYEIDKDMILMKISKIEVELDKDEIINLEDNKKEELRLFASNSKTLVKDLKLQEIQENNCLISAYSYFQMNYFIRLFQSYHNKLAVIALSTILTINFDDDFLSGLLSILILLFYYIALFVILIYLCFKQTELYLMEYIKSVGAIYLGCSTIHKSTYSIYLIFFQNFVCLTITLLWNYRNFMLSCLICIYALKICFISFSTPFYKANKVIFESISEIFVLVLLCLAGLTGAYAELNDNKGFKYGSITILCLIVVIRFIRFVFDYFFKLKELLKAKILDVNPIQRIQKVIVELEAEIVKTGITDDKTTDRLKLQKHSLFV